MRDMHYRIINVLLAAILSIWTSAAEAQDLKQMRNLNQVVRSGLLKFRVVAGRVSLDGSRVGNIQYPSAAGRQIDQLSIIAEDGDTKLSYKWSDGKRELAIEVSKVSKIRIQYAGKGDDAQIPVEFHQPIQGKTVLKIGPEDKRQICSAPSLWHLLLAYPAETKQYLMPLLELLHPNWKLSETAAAVEKELLGKTGDTEISGRKNWAALVEQLGDDSFAKRQAADRALRASDSAVLNYLQQLDYARLDAEQQFRVRRIIESFSDRLSDDTPEQIAAWLAGDPSVWLVLLSRPEVATRRQAVGHLTAILGAPVPVDPEANPATQKAQLEQLRQQIESSE